MKQVGIQTAQSDAAKNNAGRDLGTGDPKSDAKDLSKIQPPKPDASQKATPIPGPKPDASQKAESDVRKQHNIPQVGSEYLEKESGPKKKKVSESTLINAFLELQNIKAGNVFEAAKKLSAKQKKIAKQIGRAHV